MLQKSTMICNPEKEFFRVLMLVMVVVSQLAPVREGLESEVGLGFQTSGFTGSCTGCRMKGFPLPTPTSASKISGGQGQGQAKALAATTLHSNKSVIWSPG